MERLNRSWNEEHRGNYGVWDLISTMKKWLSVVFFRKWLNLKICNFCGINITNLNCWIPLTKLKLHLCYVHLSRDKCTELAWAHMEIGLPDKRYIVNVCEFCCTWWDMYDASTSSLPPSLLPPASLPRSILCDYKIQGTTRSPRQQKQRLKLLGGSLGSGPSTKVRILLISVFSVCSHCNCCPWCEGYLQRNMPMLMKMHFICNDHYPA